MQNHRCGHRPADQGKSRDDPLSLPKNAADENADGNLDVAIFDALNCKADGSFETEPLSPGNYVALASVYLPLTPEQLATAGRPVPAFAGRQVFTVPANGDTPNVAIRLNERE